MTTDSRKIEVGALFFALHGASFDGNDYAVAALEQGASAAVIDREDILYANPDYAERLLLVDDTLQALQALDLHLDKKMCLRLLKLGTPIAFQNLIISIGGLALQRVVNSFRYAFVAGFNAASRLVGLIELAGSSLGNAVGTFAGQNLGAGRIDRVKLGMRRAAQLAVLIGVIVAAVMILFGEGLLSLFITDSDPVKVAETHDVAYLYLVVMSLGLPMLYLLFGYRTTLQGIGDTFIPMISGVVELLMRFLCAVVLPLFMGEWGIYLSEIAAWVGAAVLLIWGYYHRIRQIESKMVVQK